MGFDRSFGHLTWQNYGGWTRIFFTCDVSLNFYVVACGWIQTVDGVL